MSLDSARPRYPLAEEVASSVIHGIGVVLSIAGLAVLVAFSAMYGNVRTVVASSVFGSTLILLYTASTLYHSIPGEMPKRVLRTLDHIAIFLLSQVPTRRSPCWPCLAHGVGVCLARSGRWLSSAARRSWACSSAIARRRW